MATSLIHTRIIYILTGGATNPGGRPLADSREQIAADGNVQLKFEASAGALHLIEASTNLVDWELIGAGSPQTNGMFQFENSQTLTS